MFSSAEEVLRFIAEENVEFIDVRFVDLPGTMQHFTVPAASFGEGVFTDGLMFDGSSIRGFQQIHESDMQLLPDSALLSSVYECSAAEAWISRKNAVTPLCEDEQNAPVFRGMTAQRPTGACPGTRPGSCPR